MFSQIKIYMYMAGAAALGILIFLFRLRGTKIDTLKDKVETGKKNLETQKIQADQAVKNEKLNSDVALNEVDVNKQTYQNVSQVDDEIDGLKDGLTSSVRL